MSTSRENRPYIYSTTTIVVIIYKLYDIWTLVVVAVIIYK